MRWQATAETGKGDGGEEKQESWRVDKREMAVTDGVAAACGTWRAVCEGAESSIERKS